MSRHVTPMTSARGMGSLPTLIEQSEGPTALRKLFGRVGLPLELTAEPHRMIPLHDLVALFENAAQMTGDPLFGLRVGTAMADGFGLWVRYARSAPTLEACLGRAARALRYHQTGTQLTLSSGGDLVRFSYHVALGQPQTRRQHLEHTLPALLQTFRSYAGDHWQPNCIEVNYPADRRLDDLERTLGVPVHAEANAFSIVFDQESLKLPLNSRQFRGPPVTWFDLRTMVRQRAPRSTAGIVFEIVQTRLLEGHAGFDGVAKKLAMGPRTLQRRLDQDGCSYRRLLSEARLARACHLLAETDQTIIEIALSLGYSDPAHFTRAFRNAVSITPNRYRRDRA